ncbi:hypothetical protein FHG87_014816 [Trinorchestia longiramus]|nr:hypothetical protein FHG87_014816 [Trinorchestia longiramus]
MSTEDTQKMCGRPPCSRIVLLSAPEEMIPWRTMVQALEVQHPPRRTRIGSMTVALAMAKLYKIATKGREKSSREETRDSSPQKGQNESLQDGSHGSETDFSYSSDEEEVSQDASPTTKPKDQNYSFGSVPPRKHRRRLARTKSEVWAELYIKTWACPPPEPSFQPFQISQFQGRTEDEFQGLAKPESMTSHDVREGTRGRGEDGGGGGESLVLEESELMVLRESKDKVEAWLRKYFK